MKKLLALAALFSLCLTLAIPARADNRVVVYPQQNPSSSQTNQATRFTRIQLGTTLANELNLYAQGQGLWSNLSVAPGTGLYVTIAPANTSTLGTLYQVIPDDPNPLPTNAPVASPSPLPADTTLVVAQGQQSATSNPLGPLTAPGSNSVYWLVEAQLQTVDTDAQSMLFVTGAGTRQYDTVNTQRVDQIVYAIKSGTPGVSPVVPAPDTGYLPVATILVPTGTSQITTPMIAMVGSTQFAGFLSAANAVVLSASPSPSPQPGNAAVAGTFSAGSFFGNGSGLTAINPNNFSTPVPILEGGTGTSTPSGVIAGGSGNQIVSGSFPAQTIDINSSPTFNVLTATSAVNTRTVQSTSTSAPIAIPSPGLVADSVDAQPGAVPSASPCPSGSVCAGQYVYAGAGITDSSILSATCVGTDGTGKIVANPSCTGSGTVSSVTASAPLASSGGTAPNISFTGTLPTANGGTDQTSWTSGDCVRAASATLLASAAGDCVTSVSASGNLSSSGGTTPAITETSSPTWTGTATGNALVSNTIINFNDSAGTGTTSTLTSGTAEVGCGLADASGFKIHQGTTNLIAGDGVGNVSACGHLQNNGDPTVAVGATGSVTISGSCAAGTLCTLSATPQCSSNYLCAFMVSAQGTASVPAYSTAGVMNTTAGGNAELIGIQNLSATAAIPSGTVFFYTEWSGLY